MPATYGSSFGTSMQIKPNDKINPRDKTAFGRSIPNLLKTESINNTCKYNLLFWEFDKINNYS